MAYKHLPIVFGLALAACASNDENMTSDSMSHSVDEMQVIAKPHSTPTPKCIIPALAQTTSEMDNFREQVAQQRAIDRKSADITEWNEAIAEEEPVLLSAMDNDIPVAVSLKQDAEIVEGTMTASDSEEITDLGRIDYAQAPQDILVLSSGTTEDAMPPMEFNLSKKDIRKAYKCSVKPHYAHYENSNHLLVRDFGEWDSVTKEAFFSPDLGNRYVKVYANDRAQDKIPFDKDIDRDINVGGILGVTTMEVSKDGVVTAGPLLLIEKMGKGFNAIEGNYRYVVANAEGKVEAVTRGLNSGSAQLCPDCTVLDADLLYVKLLNAGILPEAWQEKAAIQREAKEKAAAFEADQAEEFIDPNASDEADLLDPAPTLELDPNV